MYALNLPHHVRVGADSRFETEAIIEECGAKKVLLPITSAADLGLVPADLIGCFNLVFYQSAEDAVYKALGVE